MHNPTWPPVAKLSYSWEVHLNLGLGSSIGPSGVRALPLAAGINEGGHYFRYFSTSSCYHRYSKPQKGLSWGFKFLHGLLTNINKNSGKKIKFGPPPGPLGAIFRFF